MTDAQQGLGRIFKRYRVFWIAYYHRGKERRESSHSRSRTDALRLLKRRLGEIGQGKLVGPQEERLTIDEILADLLTDYQVNGRASLPTLRAHLKALRVTFGGDKALSVRTSRIKAAQRAWQEAGVTNANINRRCTVLRRAFNLAKRAEKLSTVPYIPRLEEHAVPGKFITRDAFAAIHRHLPPLLQDFFELAYLTGVRRGQLARTTLANVNTERWALVWEPGQVKNRRAHVIPLDGRALAQLPQLGIRK